jgi:glutaredoxin
MPFQPTIAIDYDGTIVKHVFPLPGEPLEGVKEAFALFKKLGYRLLIYSCRTCRWYPEIFRKDGEPMGLECSYAQDMKRVLDENQIPYDEIDDGLKGKPVAEIYIDDKGWRFNGNWAETAALVAALLGPARVYA